jgi:predicted DNA-binding transcriptional regulator AlpA
MNQEDEPKLFLTIPELCSRWNVGPQVLYRIRKHGTAPLHVKFGKEVRYPIAEVLAAEQIDPRRRNPRVTPNPF